MNKTKNNKKIGIYDENHTLTSAALWGPIGVEAVLAQMYPSDISLFLDKMDVASARSEVLHYAEVLQKENVQIWFARDILAQNIPLQSLETTMVLDSLIQKATDIKDTFQSKIHFDYRSMIENLLLEDIERYGKDQALNLNWKLSLFPFLPMGNILYARDQMNVLLNKRVSSQMKKDIRKGEVDLYEIVYQKGLGLIDDIIEIPSHETFEGGDAYIHNNTIFVGVGPRTSMGAALCIYKNLQKEIQERNYTFVVVEDEDSQKKSQLDQMLYMHLDTFSNPVGDKQIAVCLSEAQKRRVKIIEGTQNETTIRNTGQSFLEYLFKTGEEIIEVPDDEQYSFGCNFLALDENTILVPLDTNRKTIDGLEKVGKRVEYVHLDECTKGFGAAHCMTGQLQRVSSSVIN